MAASVLTLDTNEWIYLDRTGSPHTVTNAQTFSMTVVDGGASAVEYSIPSTGQSVTTTDGRVIRLLPRADGNNTDKTIHFLTDAGQGSNFLNRGGEYDMVFDEGNIVQHWKVAKINPSDADFGSAGTITMTLEDQFGNVMVMPAPAVGGSITVAQAA